MIVTMTGVHVAQKAIIVNIVGACGTNTLSMLIGPTPCDFTQEKIDECVGAALRKFAEKNPNHNILFWQHIKLYAECG